jgi:hypothetical protein
MARANTKIGDVFSAKVADNAKRYFQLIAFDRTQLNSDVIRAFKTAYPLAADPDLAQVVGGDVDFYAHCITRLGLRMGLWEKVAHTAEIGDTSDILFRDTRDWGRKLGEEPVRVSSNWYVWHINDEGFTHVGRLEGDNRRAEIGVVVSARDIVQRLQGNGYPFSYPGFE